ncbi:MAG: succinate dehydrogenase cytochrome b subunit [Cyanobacteria bacterium REEB459]|nr:succinate dehydrogenase cytochrome b subunit [Cyanobacteria bacterium REEB459]
MTDVLQAPPPQPSVSGLLGIYQSPIGKKLISGLTGLTLTTFVVVHLVGNLWFLAGSQAYNAYAHHLESWGWALRTLELGLGIALLFHGAVGITIFLNRWRSRPQGYQQYQSVGHPSYQTLSSRTMILTGVGLGLFLVSHLATFKLGPHYPTQVQGEPARDLARLVIQVFRQPPYLITYSLALLGLGLHLRHGIWSGLQSLGLLQGGIRSLAYTASLVVAIAVVLGFLVLPWGIYLGAIA